MSLLSHKWWDSCNFFGGMRILGAQLSTPQAPRICENDSWCLQLHASASSAFSKPNAGRKPQVVLCTLGVFIPIQGISRRQPSLVSSSLTILCHTRRPLSFRGVKLDAVPYNKSALSDFSESWVILLAIPLVPWLPWWPLVTHCQALHPSWSAILRVLNCIFLFAVSGVYVSTSPTQRQLPRESGKMFRAP